MSQLDILLGMPSHDGTLAIQTMMAVDNMVRFMSEKKITMMRPYLQGSSLPALRDTMCAERAIAENARYLMFIDADMVFRPDDVYRLMERNVDVVGGLAFGKAAPYPPVCATFRSDGFPVNCMYGLPDFYDKMQEGALVDVYGTGTGFMLIKTEVLKEVKPPRFMFPWTKKYNVGSDEPFWGYGGEDYYFCKKARLAGFRVCTDFGVRVGHVGTKVYSVVDHINYQHSLQQEAARQKEQEDIQDVAAEHEKKKIDIQLAR